MGRREFGRLVATTALLQAVMALALILLAPLGIAFIVALDLAVIVEIGVAILLLYATISRLRDAGYTPMVLAGWILTGALWIWGRACTQCAGPGSTIPPSGWRTEDVLLVSFVGFSLSLVLMLCMPRSTRQSRSFLEMRECRPGRR